MSQNITFCLSLHSCHHNLPIHRPYVHYHEVRAFSDYPRLCVSQAFFELLFSLRFDPKYMNTYTCLF